MIDVLLATYNGEKYLEAQLYSLLWQTHKDWRLIVHDDGSTDNTVAIIKNFQKIDNRIILIEDGIKCGGAAKNFLHLLSMPSSSDYFIFCDQDDIWFESKLSDLRNCFVDDIPKAVFCNGYSYSIDKGIISDKITSVFPKRLEDQLFLNAGIQGCSLMFNKALKDKMGNLPNNQAMHDHFVTLFAVTFGELSYLPKNLMLYRQFHEGKATANIDSSISKRLKSEIPIIDRKHFEATLIFYKHYFNVLSDKQKSLFEEYFRYSKSNSMLEKISIILKNDFNIYGKSYMLLLKTILRKTIN